MTSEQFELLNYIQNAIDNLNKNEKYLIENNLNERAYYPKIIDYLRDQLKDTIYSDYQYDCEYNRGNNLIDFAPKMLDNKRISIDVVVHKRGHDETFGYDNLICMEVKKISNHQGCIEDEKRLSKLTDRKYGFNYALGVMLRISEKIEIKSTFFFN